MFTEPAQREPDPDFPTVAFPNPEEKGAMDKVLALATEKQADLVLANDPDADRLCVALPTGDGKGYATLTGDQVGVLLADYLLTVGAKDKRMVATSIVSSQLLGFLAEQAGADYRETLTGFKWIGNAAIDYEREHHGRFVLGYEEALGYSVGPLVRDKDGVSAALVFAELVAWNRARGKTVRDQLDDIYRRVGMFVTEQVSITKPGTEGLAQIKAAMVKFREAPPSQLGGHAVERVVDLVLRCTGRRNQTAAVRRAGVQARGRSPRDHAAERDRAQAQELLRSAGAGRSRREGRCRSHARAGRPGGVARRAPGDAEVDVASESFAYSRRRRALGRALDRGAVRGSGVGQQRHSAEHREEALHVLLLLRRHELEVAAAVDDLPVLLGLDLG